MRKALKIIAWVFLLLPVVALASGLQVSPSKLKITTTGGKGEAELTIANPTSDVQLFEVTADDFTREIKFFPSSFTLESGQSKKIRVAYTASGQKDFVISTFISIVGKPLVASGLQTNAGAKIPLSISISEKPAVANPLALYLVVSVAVLCLAAALLYYYRFSRP